MILLYIVISLMKKQINIQFIIFLLYFKKHQVIFQNLKVIMHIYDLK